MFAGDGGMLAVYVTNTGSWEANTPPVVRSGLELCIISSVPQQVVTPQ